MLKNDEKTTYDGISWKTVPLGLKFLIGLIVVLMTLSLGIQYKTDVKQDVYRHMAFEKIDEADKTADKPVLYIEVDETLLKAEAENDIIKHAVEKGWTPTYKGQTGMTFVKVK